MAVAERGMERKMTGSRLQDRISNIDLRLKSRVADVVTRVAELKFQWAGHLARGNQWSTLISEWIPRSDRRRRGRPATRWDDDIRKSIGTTWRRAAQDRFAWSQRKKAFAQEWAAIG